MNLFFSEIAESLVTALLHFVWQGAVLALILFSVVKLFDVRSARSRHALSVVALMLMAFAPILTILWSRYDATPIPSAQLLGQSQVVVNNNASIAGATEFDWRQIPANWRRSDVKLAVIFTWLAGVLILSTRLAVGFAMTLWIRTNVKPLAERFEQLVQKLGKRIKVNAVNRVYTSMRVGQAMAVGIIRPIVLIPTAWLTALSPQMLEAVIAHELAHIRRWDLWVNMLQRVVEVLLFYHPAVWWLSNRMSLEREMCCDEIAANCLDRAEYARALESVAQISRGNLLLATSIQGETQMNLLNRIRYLLGNAPVEVSGNWWAAGFVAMIFPILALTVVSITTGSNPNTVVADEGKTVAAETATPAAVNLTNVEDANITGEAIGFINAGKSIGVKITGETIGIKMTGDAAKECVRLMSPDKTLKSGQDVDLVGKITRILPDGRFKIENTIPIEDHVRTIRQFSMTIVAESSQIKVVSRPEKNSPFVNLSEMMGTPILNSINGKRADLQSSFRIIGSVGSLYKTGENTGAIIFASLDRSYVEISDLKSVTFRVWELKEQIGE